MPLMLLRYIRKRHNGCELPVLGPQAQVSGRGSVARLVFLKHASSLSLAPGAESTVRSSELLGGMDYC
jgi:hypothetical protein